MGSFNILNVSSSTFSIIKHARLFFSAIVGDAKYFSLSFLIFQCRRVIEIISLKKTQNIGLFCCHESILDQSFIPVESQYYIFLLFFSIV